MLQKLLHQASAKKLHMQHVDENAEARPSQVILFQSVFYQLAVETGPCHYLLVLCLDSWLHINGASLECDLILKSFHLQNCKQCALSVALELALELASAKNKKLLCAYKVARKRQLFFDTVKI